MLAIFQQEANLVRYFHFPLLVFSNQANEDILGGGNFEEFHLHVF